MIVTSLIGDITEQTTDAIVNAANNSLTGGGGVDGAIHRAAGPELLEACREYPICRTGDAVITDAFNLLCKYVIHTAGPVWRDGTMNETTLLRSCYRACYRLAQGHGIRSISFPAISTGAYGFPKQKAAEIAITATKEFAKVDEVYFVLFDQLSADVYKSLIPKII